MMMIKNNNLRAIYWALAWFLISNINDVITKYLGYNVPTSQLVFLRFTFASLFLIPIIYYKGGIKLIKTPNHPIYMIRGILLYVGILLWSYGLKHVEMAAALTLNSTIPFVNLIMCLIFLKEKFSWDKIIITMICFIGIIIITRPFHAEFNKFSLVIILSVFLFSSLDVLNKKYVVIESNLAMLFNTALWTSIFSMPAAIYLWEPIMFGAYIQLIILGIGANLILYCILKAFTYAEASYIAPFRYLELIFAVISGYIFFSEIPENHTIIGMSIIVIANFALLIKSTKSVNNSSA